MPDFEKLYARPAGQGKRPPQWRPGDYPMVVRALEDMVSREKKTPGMRYFLTILDWPEGLSDAWTETDEHGKVWEYTKDEVDLSRRQVSFDFWFPVDAETGEPTRSTDYMFDDFLRSGGLEPEGRSYEELRWEVIGKRGLVEMRPEVSQDGSRIFVRAKRLVLTP